MPKLAGVGGMMPRSACRIGRQVGNLASCIALRRARRTTKYVMQSQMMTAAAEQDVIRAILLPFVKDDRTVCVSASEPPNEPFEPPF